MKYKTWLTAVVILALLNVWWFWPGNLYFLNDDLLHIPLTEKGEMFQTNSIRPVHELLLKLELFLWVRNAFGYHLTALLLHFVVCFQLYKLGLTIQTKWYTIEADQAQQASLLAAVLFLAYPQSSESLGWIIGRAPALAGIFVLITFRRFFIQTFQFSDYIAGAVFFALALLTYEQIILLPLALFLTLPVAKKSVDRLAMLRYTWLLIAVDVCYVVARKLVTAEVIGEYEGRNFLSFNFGTLIANAFRLILRLVLNPADKELFVASALVLFAAIFAVAFYCYKARFNKKPVLFFTAAVVLLAAPVVSLGTAISSFESGRYLYLPSIFLILGVSVIAANIYYLNIRLRKILITLLIILPVYWLIGKYTAAHDYQAASQYEKGLMNKIRQHFKSSSDTLYIDTLRITVRRLPVNRLGFVTGLKWLNPYIDTKKIVVKHYYDETVETKKK